MKSGWRQSPSSHLPATHARGASPSSPRPQAAVPSSPGSVECEFVLPEGEYVISIYQDLNANGKLDTNLVGIPKEPVGISGYSGSGIPGGFDKLKMKIDAGVKSVSVNLAKI